MPRTKKRNSTEKKNRQSTTPAAGAGGLQTRNNRRRRRHTRNQTKQNVTLRIGENTESQTKQNVTQKTEVSNSQKEKEKELRRIRRATLERRKREREAIAAAAGGAGAGAGAGDSFRQKTPLEFPIAAAGAGEVMIRMKTGTTLDISKKLISSTIKNDNPYFLDGVYNTQYNIILNNNYDKNTVNYNIIYHLTSLIDALHDNSHKPSIEGFLVKLLDKIGLIRKDQDNNIKVDFYSYLENFNKNKDDILSTTGFFELNNVDKFNTLIHDIILFSFQGCSDIEKEEIEKNKGTRFKSKLRCQYADIINQRIDRFSIDSNYINHIIQNIPDQNSLDFYNDYLNNGRMINVISLLDNHLNTRNEYDDTVYQPDYDRALEILKVCFLRLGFKLSDNVVVDGLYYNLNEPLFDETTGQNINNKLIYLSLRNTETGHFTHLYYKSKREIYYMIENNTIFTNERDKKANNKDDVMEENERTIYDFFIKDGNLEYMEHLEPHIPVYLYFALSTLSDYQYAFTGNNERFSIIVTADRHLAYIAPFINPKCITYLLELNKRRGRNGFRRIHNRKLFEKEKDEIDSVDIANDPLMLN
jgi:hypothetical protein